MNTVNSDMVESNWFLYWQMSPSLWKERLAKYTERKILIPINWGLHFRRAESIDFGEILPETDIARLVNVLKDLKITPILVIPVTPVPFMERCGVPVHIAASMAIDDRGMIQAFAYENEINKAYSFFDTEVFKGFFKFCKAFSRYLKSFDIRATIISGEFVKPTELGMISYLEDTSFKFEEAFKRYLDKKSISEIQDPIAEQKEIIKFNSQILSVYIGAIRDNFESYSRHILVSILGGDNNVLNKLFNAYDYKILQQELFSSVCAGTIPSSILIPSNVKEGILTKELSDLVNDNFISDLTITSEFDGEDSVYKQLCFFQFYGITFDFDEVSPFTYLQKQYPWQYRFKDIRDILVVSDGNVAEKIHLFMGINITTQVYHYILDLFTNGATVLVDTAGLNPAFLKKFAFFCMANKVNIEKVKYLIEIENIVFAKGRMLFYNSKQLKKHQVEEVDGFWQKVFSTTNVKSVAMNAEVGVECFWWQRIVSSNDLNYDAIRRVNIYNATGYKRRVKINLNKNFALMKIGDSHNAIANSDNSEVEIKLFPKGHIGLDFGVYS